MAQFEQHFVQDLTQQIKVRHCGSIVFNADNESNVVSVSLFNGSEPVAISGSVVGSVICPDGATVPLTGSYSGNTASVTLTGDCFAVIGQISVGIQIVNGTQKITVLKAYYDVEALTTENVVDPGSRITLEVGDLVDAIDEAVASIPEDYTALTAEVADIKSVNKIFNRDVVGVPNPIDTATWIDNANLNYSGATKAAQDWKVTEGYIETSADSYKISYNNSETLYIVQVAGYTSSGSFVRMFANADSSSGVRSFTIDTTSVDKIRIATRYGNPILSVYPNDGKIVEKLASVEDDVSDLKSAIDNTNNEIYKRSNTFSEFILGGRNTDGSLKPSTTRATCKATFRLNAGDVLACAGNASGMKYGIGGDCDDGTFYDSGWKTDDFSYTVAKSGLYYVNSAMSNGTDTIDPDNVTLVVTITDNTSRIAQNTDAISSLDALCGFGERITSENYSAKLSDFNSANTNTIYNIFNCLTSISNYPSDCDYQSGTLITLNGRETDTNWTLQMFATKKDNKATIYFRYYIDSAWLAWVKLPQNIERNANTEIINNFVATSVSRDVAIDSNTKILGFGDSIMQGYSQITKNWLELVGDEIGCTSVNKAVGGACFGESVAASNYWISTQISGATETEWNNATLIIVAAGTNDAGNSTPLSELKTKVQSAITSIKAATDAPILFITPIRRGSSASDANLLKLPSIAGVIANVALANGCSIVNGFDFPIATYDIGQIDDMTIDHLHPNNTGTAVYAQTLLSIIK